MKDKSLERFLNYIAINTRSDASSTSIPSSQNQFDLARYLVKECQEMGLEDVHMDEYGIVMASLKTNQDKPVPTLGFIAHMDTADFNGKNIKPRIIENYDGQDILLNKEKNIQSLVADFPNLKNHQGKTLVVTDGTSLLGADDKAGIAAIMSAMEYLLAHPEIPRANIRIAFTIDEEIGRGADSFDLDRFQADFAYTIDGGALGGLEYENFNAASVTLDFKGLSVHPGSAKDSMVNALVLAHGFFAELPKDQRPEHTENYEGFYLLTNLSGNVEEARMELIIRDHDQAEFQAKKDRIESLVEKMRKEYAYDRIDYEIKDSYYNMKEIIQENMEVVDLAKEAMEALNIEPVIQPIRGGTAGAQLSFRGLPCPNLFTGGENFHGPHEYLVVETMIKSAQLIAKIAELAVK